jgi:hypothetical protein
VRFIGIAPGAAERSALAQQIPTLIQFDLKVPQPQSVGIRHRFVFPSFEQSMLLFDQLLNTREDWLIGGFGFVLH